MPKTNLQSLGKAGEIFASHYLTQKGYRIIARNFRTRFGELDIVAIKDEALIFIEVKTRHSLRFGEPEEAVTKSKMSNIILAGQIFCKKFPHLPQKLAVEVVAIKVEFGKVSSVKIIKA
jgi:putative endonuclease